MIVQEIKTLYRGMAAIHEKFVNRALEEDAPLMLMYGKERMILSPEQLRGKILQRSPVFQDKFGRGDYQLIYYHWIPIEEQVKEEVKQGTLFS